MSKTFSQLPITTSLTGVDVIPLEQSSLTKQATFQNVATSIAPLLPAGTGTDGLVRQTNPTINGLLTLNGNIKGTSNSAAYSIVAGSSDPGVFGSGAWVSLYGGTAVGATGALVFGSNTSNTGIITSSGNFGIGTTSPAAKLHVTGSFICESAVRITDPSYSNLDIRTSGAPLDKKFSRITHDVNGIISIDRVNDAYTVATSLINWDASNICQITGPVKIGAAGTSVSSVVSTVISSYAPAAIAANGGVQTADFTLTGLTSASNVWVNSFTLSNNSIIVRAENVSPNTVRVYWINPTASPVTLSACAYRISAIVFY